MAILKCPRCGLTGRDNVFPEKLDDLRAFQLKYILLTKCQLIWCNPGKKLKKNIYKKKIEIVVTKVEDTTYVT